MGGFEHCGKHLNRGVEGVGAAWPVVLAAGNGVEVSLDAGGQIGTFERVLTQQPVGDLAAAWLPEAVRVTTIDLHARVARELGAALHRLALIMRQAVVRRYTDRKLLAFVAAFYEFM
jgi:hypothetical protein